LTFAQTKISSKNVQTVAACCRTQAREIYRKDGREQSIGRINYNKKQVCITSVEGTASKRGDAEAERRKKANVE
jgi:hypothetical protein